MTAPAARATGANGRLLRRATYASVGVALLLIVIKAAGWLFTGSVSLLTTLVDSLIDFAAAAVNLWAVRQALQPPDRQYRFGYGKAEPLAGLGQAAFVAGTAVFLVVESVRRILAPQPVVHEAVGIAIMAVSMLATFLLVRFQAHVVRRTGSVAIGADSLHYKGDFLVHGGVILSLLLHAWLGWTWIDPLFALGVAAYIVFNAKIIATASLRALMDRELPDADRRRIAEIALSHAGVINLHDLRTRSSGPNVFIQFHLELPADMSLLHAHEIADAVERAVQAAFPGSSVIVHEDPQGVVEGWAGRGVPRFDRPA